MQALTLQGRKKQAASSSDCPREKMLRTCDAFTWAKQAICNAHWRNRCTGLIQRANTAQASSGSLTHRSPTAQRGASIAWHSTISHWTPSRPTALPSHDNPRPGGRHVPQRSPFWCLLRTAHRLKRISDVPQPVAKSSTTSLAMKCTDGTSNERFSAMSP
jgi:hypothetical protein